jgi:hypothetical protein
MERREALLYEELENSNLLLRVAVTATVEYLVSVVREGVTLAPHVDDVVRDYVAIAMVLGEATGRGRLIGSDLRLRGRDV